VLITAVSYLVASALYMSLISIGLMALIYWLSQRVG
jgi:hypothetical protein